MTATRQNQLSRMTALESLGETRTREEEVEFDELQRELNIGNGSIEPEGSAIQAELDTLPERAPKPTRKRTPKEAIEQKRREKTAIFPLTVLLDTDKGTYQYLNSQAELDENAGAVLREPERFVIIQGERKSPAVNWK